MLSERLKIVDASQPRVRIHVAVAEAAELLLSAGALLGEHGTDAFELGTTPITEIRQALPAELEAQAKRLLASEALSAHLMGLVYATPEPRTVDAFLAHLETLEATELQRHLLGYHVHSEHGAARPIVAAAAEGDRDAIRELLAATLHWREKRELLEYLTTVGPEVARAELLALLGSWHATVVEPTLAELRVALARDVAAKRPLAAALAAADFVARVAPGIEYVLGPETRELAFFPTWWFRPWVFLSEHDDTRICCYPITRDGVSASERASLARLYRALGDERRLELLQLLQGGTVTLAEATRALGVAKSTVHHHLAILRQAGLVVIREGDHRSYALPSGRAADIERLLYTASR